MAWFRKDKTPEIDFLKDVLNLEKVVGPSERQGNVIPSNPYTGAGHLAIPELRDLPLDTIGYQNYQYRKVTGKEFVAINITIYRGKLR